MPESEQPEKSEKRGNFFQIFLEETIGVSLLVPILAVFTGLLLGGVIVALTTEQFYAAWSQSPLVAIQVGAKAAWEAYVALFNGSIGNPAKIVAAFRSGNGMEIRQELNPFFGSLTQSIPYMFAGLAVALGFRAGLFNIGAEGQLFIGAITAAIAGYAITGLPAIIHIPLALLIGALGGAVSAIGTFSGAEDSRVP